MQKQIVRTLLTQAVHDLQAAAEDQQRCWTIALATGDQLYRSGASVVDSLIELLTDKDRNVVALAAIYLGMLGQLVNAEKAIEPLVRIGQHTKSGIVQVASAVALDLLGYEPARTRIAQILPEEDQSDREHQRKELAVVFYSIALGWD